MNVLPIYLFFIRPSVYGMPDWAENPCAAGVPESGTPITISASAGLSIASCLPILCLISKIFLL